MEKKTIFKEGKKRNEREREREIGRKR